MNFRKISRKIIFKLQEVKSNEKKLDKVHCKNIYKIVQILRVPAKYAMQ